MSTANITIDQAGTNHLSIDGSPASPVHGTGQAAQTTAMAQIRDHAANTQQTVTLHVQDNDGGTFNLQVAPDGQVWTAPPAQPEPAAAWEQDPAPLNAPRVDQTPPPAPIVTEVPGAQNSTDLEATRPRHVAPTQPTPTPVPTGAEDQVSPAPAEPAAPALTGVPAIPAPAQAQNPTDSQSSEPDPLEADPRWPEISQQPAEQGLRGTLNGMGMKLAPTPGELEQRRETLRQQVAQEEQERRAEEERDRTEAAQQTRRAARAREDAQRDHDQRALIQTNFGDCRSITAANSKGGSHKTTVMAILAATFGRIRGGGVIAWDANETMGTLGDRTLEDLHSNTVVDLLENSADDFASVETSRIGTIDKYTRPQGDNHFTVLASDEDPERQDMVDGVGFRTVHQILARFNRMIFVDTGNNARADHFLAAIEATDQLVIPVSAGLDSALVAEKMMKALTARGHGDLVQNAVVMLHDSESRKINDSDTARRFEGKVSAVVPVPFDPALKDGGKIDYDALQPATRRAYQEAAAAIASNLRDRVIKENQA